MEKLTPLQHKELIKANIAGSYNNVESFIEKSTVKIFDPLIKGEISQNFDNRDSSIRFLKTGKEIKEKLQLLLAEHRAQYVVLKDKLSDLVSHIAKEPDQKDDCSWRGVEVEYNPLRYDWSLCYAKESNESSLTSINTPKTNTVENLCREYNRAAEDIVDCQVEQKLIEIMLNNFQDNQEYPLTIKQGAVLKF